MQGVRLAVASKVASYPVKATAVQALFFVFLKGSTQGLQGSIPGPHPSVCFSVILAPRHKEKRGWEWDWEWMGLVTTEQVPKLSWIGDCGEEWYAKWRWWVEEVHEGDVHVCTYCVGW